MRISAAHLLAVSYSRFQEAEDTLTAAVVGHEENWRLQLFAAETYAVFGSWHGVLDCLARVFHAEPDAVKTEIGLISRLLIQLIAHGRGEAVLGLLQGSPIRELVEPVYYAARTHEREPVDDLPAEIADAVREVLDRVGEEEQIAAKGSLLT
jgi:hypothetical protein